MFSRITEIVKHLIIINVIVFFGMEALKSIHIQLPHLGVFYPTHPSFSPYQLISHIFVHGDFSHLFFNMLMLFFMGPIVEGRIGSKKFLIIFLAAGILSSFFDWGANAFLAQLNLVDMLEVKHTFHVGASGAIFGIVAAFGLLFPNMEVMLLIPPIPIKGKYLTLILLGFGIIFGFGQSIGHLSHLGGAIIGALMVYYWLKKAEI